MTEHFFNYLEPESIDKLDLKFNNPDEYFKHRKNNGFDLNWTNIKIYKKI